MLSRAQETPSRPDLVVAAERLPLTGIHVLVVDDDEAAREALQVVLKSEGADVTTADSAAAALSELAHGHPDAMLVDIAMPVVDGFTMVEQLRLRADPDPVPVAALTGYCSAEDQSRASRAGFQAYLIKPVDPAELIGAVKALAGGRRCDSAPRV